MLKNPFQRQGILFCLSGPAGSGKTSIAQMLLSSYQDSIRQSVSYTTRTPRAGESDGKSYNFVNHETFLKMKQQGLFFEDEEIHGQYYATPRAAVEESIGGAYDLILVVDIKGALNFKRHFPDNCVICFIIPPDFSELKKRMSSRGSVEEEELNRRLATARQELETLESIRNDPQAVDYLILNENLNDTFSAVNSIIQVERFVLKRIKDKQLIK